MTRALVLFAHPCPESFSAALHAREVADETLGTAVLVHRIHLPQAQLVRPAEAGDGETDEPQRLLLLLLLLLLAFPFKTNWEVLRDTH